MAVIEISPGIVWGGSASLFRFIVTKIQENTSIPRLSGRLTDVERGYTDLNLSHLDKTEREEVCKAVSAMVSDVKKAGEDAFGGPANFRGFLAKLEELERMVGAAKIA